MTPLPRCPRSLMQTIADVLATPPLLESLSASDEEQPSITWTISTARVYTGIVALTGA